MGGVLATIDDDATFRRVGVRFGTLVWPGDIDLDPDVIIWGGAPPTDHENDRPPSRMRVPIPV